MDEIVFSSLIAFNGKLRSQCDNLSTHHDHTTYYPCFDTQFRHSQTTQQYFCAVAISHRKSESDRAALLYQRDGKEKTRKLLWQRLDRQEKGILAKVVKDTQRQLNPAVVVVPGDFVAIPALRARRHVLFFVVFVPVTFKFVPFFVLFRHC